MSAEFIDGRAIAARITKRVTSDIAKLDITPGLGVVLIGDDEASHLYVSIKEKACKRAGIMFDKTILPKDAKQSHVIEAIALYNAREDIDAILLQLPLPEQLDTEEAIRTMDPEKDVDGFHPWNVDALVTGHPTIIPGLAAGIIKMLEYTEMTLPGMKAVVVSNSNEFHRSLGALLERNSINSMYIDPDDEKLAETTKEADILVVAVGRPHFITGEMIKPEAIVIDVGTNTTPEGLKGDIDTESSKAVASHITPVPGGVGPITVAMLLANTYEIAKHRKVS